jgi:hypothetical protein
MSASGDSAVRREAKAAAATVALVAAVSFLGAVFSERSLFATGAQALAADFGAGRIRDLVDEPKPPTPTSQVAVRVALGLALGVAAALVVLGVARAAGQTPPLGPMLSPWTAPATLLAAGVTALRDEMLLRAPILAIAGHRSRTFALVSCALASVAWALGGAGNAGVPLSELASEALAGAAFGALWMRNDEPWTAVGARFAWLATATMSGAGGAAASSPAGAVALVLPCAAAIAWVTRGRTTSLSVTPPST